MFFLDQINTSQIFNNKLERISLDEVLRRGKKVMIKNLKYG